MPDAMKHQWGLIEQGTACEWHSRVSGQLPKLASERGCLSGSPCRACRVGTLKVLSHRTCHLSERVAPVSMPLAFFPGIPPASPVSTPAGAEQYRRGPHARRCFGDRVARALAGTSRGTQAGWGPRIAGSDAGSKTRRQQAEPAEWPSDSCRSLLRPSDALIAS